MTTAAPKRAAYLATGLALLMGPPAAAELRIEATADGAAWLTSAPVAADGTEIVDLLGVSPYWIVQCPSPGQCYARSSFIVIALDDSGRAHMHLDPHPQGQVSLMLADYAFELEPIIDTPLPPTWEERLRDPEALLLIERDHAVAEHRRLTGIGMALDHLRTATGLVPDIEEDSPLAILADSAQRDLEGGGRLVPDTKPQIEFAIRAQLDSDDPFDETAPSTLSE